MNYLAYRYVQQDQEFLSLVLPFYVIRENSKVLVYGEDIYGYQRLEDRKHYLKIKKELMDTENPALLPTSIILSANKNEIYNTIEELTGFNDVVQIDIRSEIQFRIVDGQHRIKGLEEAAESDSSFNEYKLNVIILLTEEDKRAIEIDVFRDINSKAKKIKTDLTQLARHNYRLLGQKEINDHREFIEHLSIKTAYYLNEDKDINSKVWSHGIKFDIHTNRSAGVIGVSAFISSIEKIVKRYIKSNIGQIDVSEFSNKEIIDFANSHSFELAKFIDNIWGIVKEKWEDCFVEQTTNDFDKLVKTYYNSGYYIQKTTGVNAIHEILFSCLGEENFDEQVAVTSFKTIIDESKVQTNDWITGGKFSGLTSKSGFNKAKNIILEKTKKEK
jgi:DGQHR domain-containing protein